MAGMVRATRSRVREAILRQSREALAEVAKENQMMGNRIAQRYRRVTASWVHRPGFRVVTEITPEKIAFTVEPTGEHAPIWHYVDKGTGTWGDRGSPYPIRAKNPAVKPLKFRTGYSPKTAPVAQANVGSGTAGGDWVTKDEVMHPGIEPRDFSKTYRDELKREYRERMENAMRRGIRRAK